MKAKRKPKGTKAGIQESRKRSRYAATVITVAILVSAIAISSFFVYSFLSSSPNQIINPEQTDNQPSKPQAALVDHLSLTCPNQTFIQAATNTLEQAGYTVDYYPGEEVTVEFYRNLPTHGYKLIILRVHSAIEYSSQSVALFTSEKYTQGRYIYEQLDDRLYEGQIETGFVEGLTYFGIAPNFVTKSMRGDFQNSMIIMMGCNGLTYTNMAEAFEEKGAKVYISWNGSVLASHTDQATAQLLKHLITEEQTIEQTITKTMEEVGPDPVHKSVLHAYPEKAGE